MTRESIGPRRWLLTNDRLPLMDSRHVYGRLDDGESIDVMPVSEHEELREAARVVVEAFFETGELSNMKLDRLRTALGQEHGS